jgi:hypothetical protein
MVQVQDHVGQRLHRHVVVLVMQFDAQTADGSMKLKGETAVIVQIELEQA